MNELSANDAFIHSNTVLANLAFPDNTGPSVTDREKAGWLHNFSLVGVALAAHFRNSQLPLKQVTAFTGTTQPFLEELEVPVPNLTFIPHLNLLYVYALSVLTTKDIARIEGTSAPWVTYRIKHAIHARHKELWGVENTTKPLYELKKPSLYWLLLHAGTPHTIATTLMGELPFPQLEMHREDLGEELYAQIRKLLNKKTQRARQHPNRS